MPSPSPEVRWGTAHEAGDLETMMPVLLDRVLKSRVSQLSTYQGTEPQCFLPFNDTLARGYATLSPSCGGAPARMG